MKIELQQLIVAALDRMPKRVKAHDCKVRGANVPMSAIDRIRCDLFLPLGTMERRQKRHFADIDHPRDSRGLWVCLGTTLPIPDADTLVAWSVTPVADLSRSETLTLEQIRAAASEMAKHRWLAGSADVIVDVREHRGVCSLCHRSIADKSALVSCRWGDRTLTREYRL